MLHHPGGNMYIYKITNLINGKIYIGQTTLDPIQRFNKHWNEANCKNRPNNYFHNALLKYGKENFKIEILDTASSLEELNQKEREWIEKLNATDKEIGYNLQEGGQSGKRGIETSKKISAKKKENWKDPEFASKCRNGLKKATLAWQKKCKERQVTLICQNCGKEFKVPPHLSHHKYCSLQCANAVNVKKATEAAAKKKHQETLNRNASFFKEIEQWAICNKDKILNCPANKISTTLIEIQQIASEKYSFSDWRSISKALCGSNSKKDLLLFLKEICENVR